MKRFSRLSANLLLVLLLALTPQLALQSASQPELQSVPQFELQFVPQPELQSAPQPALHFTPQSEWKTFFIACEFGPGSCPCPGC